MTILVSVILRVYMLLHLNYLFSVASTQGLALSIQLHLDFDCNVNDWIDQLAVNKDRINSGFLGVLHFDIFLGVQMIELINSSTLEVAKLGSLQDSCVLYLYPWYVPWSANDWIDQPAICRGRVTSAFLGVVPLDILLGI